MFKIMWQIGQKKRKVEIFWWKKDQKVEKKYEIFKVRNFEEKKWKKMKKRKSSEKIVQKLCSI